MSNNKNKKIMNIIKSGKVLQLSDNIELLNAFESKNYNISYDYSNQVVLATEKEDFILPSKIYGNLQVAEHTIHRFKNTDRNLGLILNGTSGSGKTLTGKYVCQKLELPVFFISNSQTPTDKLASFISSLEQDAVFFFDEFEKIYLEEKEQNEFLSLLDGLFNCSYKRLFIFTSNEDKVSRYIVNRPSRVFYKQDYNSISPDVLNEICKDKGLDKETIKLIDNLYDKFNYQFNIDITMSLISEMQMFNIPSPEEAFKLLNVKIPKIKYNVYYEDKLVCKEFETDFSIRDNYNRKIWINNKLYVSDSENYKNIEAHSSLGVMEFYKSGNNVIVKVEGCESDDVFELSLKNFVPEIEMSQINFKSLIS